MSAMEDLLNKCAIDELRYTAEENKVSSQGNKADLIKRLVGIPPKKVLQNINNSELQKLLTHYNLPRNGNKNELMKRLLTVLKIRDTEQSHKSKTIKTNELTSIEKGSLFEKQVTSWSKKRFKAEFAKPTQIRRFDGVRTHQIDAHVRIKKWGSCDDIWIECKNLKETIKRDHIIKLVHGGQDAYQAFKNNLNDFYFNGLILVSNSPFDIDALNCANEYDVLCVYYDGKHYIEQNNPKNWLGNPYWLKKA